MSKEDVLLFGTYGMRGTGKSYYEKLKEKDKEIEKLKIDYQQANDIIVEQTNKIENLTNDLEREKSQVKEYGTRLLKTIEYIEQQMLHKFQDTTGGLTYNERKLLDILKGDDKDGKN